jgi:hypothetical protein
MVRHAMWEQPASRRSMLRASFALSCPFEEDLRRDSRSTRHGFFEYFRLANSLADAVFE